MNPFRRFGARYLQLFVHSDQVKIVYAGIRPVEYPLNMQPFRSKSTLRNSIYETCVRTLINCMHEHYEDCPWREQALYTMDSRNQMLFNKTHVLAQAVRVSDQNLMVQEILQNLLTVKLVAK